MAEAVVTVSMMQATGKSCRSMLHDGWLGCVLPSFWLMDGAGGGVQKKARSPHPACAESVQFKKAQRTVAATRLRWRWHLLVVTIACVLN
jgi:hypothetical protein